MKAIIDNKLYDTTTSKTIYTYGEISLWKTQNGAYFMIAHDGFKPMTVDETKEFLGKKDADMYIAEFGEVENA